MNTASGSYPVVRGSQLVVHRPGGPRSNAKGYV